MKLLLLTFLLLNTLYAQNPAIYASLGDKIYDNANGIDLLLQVETLEAHHKKIFEYMFTTSEAKKQGQMISDHNPTAISPKEYLNTLRKLSKENDYYTRIARVAYKKAIADAKLKDIKLLLDSNLLENEKSLIELELFYEVNADKLDLSIFMSYLNINENGNKVVKVKKSSGNVNASKVERLREKEKRKELANKKEIDAEIDKQKEELHKKQKSELGIK